MKWKHRGKRAHLRKNKKKGSSSGSFYQHARIVAYPAKVNISSDENKRPGDNCVSLVNSTTRSGFNNNLIADTIQKHKKKKKKKKKSAAFLKAMFGENGISANNEPGKLPEPDINLPRPTPNKNETQPHSTHAHGLDSNCKPVDSNKPIEKKDPEKNLSERVFFGPSLPPSMQKNKSTMLVVRRNGSLERVAKDSVKVAGGMPAMKSQSMENCSNEYAGSNAVNARKSLASAVVSYLGAATKKPSVNGASPFHNTQLDVNRIKKPVNPQYNGLAMNRSVSMAGTVPRPSPLASNYNGWAYKKQENLNNSCYMNTTMQVLAACPIFVSLLNLAVNSLSQRSRIIECFNDLLRWLTGKGESRGPVRRGHLMKMQGLIRHLDAIFEEWGGAAQQDAEELLTTLLDAVSDECTGKGLRHANGRRSFGFQNPIRIAPACCDPVKILEVITKNVKRCGNCDHASEVEAMEHRVHLGVGEMERDEDVPGTVKCVQQLIAAEINEVERVEDYTCERCRTKGATSGTKQYVRFGEYIIIVLKRFAHDRYGNVRKLSTPIRTPLYIEMGDFIHGKKREKEESSESREKKPEDDGEDTKKAEKTNRIEETDEERRERRRRAKKRRKMEKKRQLEAEKHVLSAVKEMEKSETDEPPIKKARLNDLCAPKEESPVKNAHRGNDESENVFPVSKSMMEQTGGGELGAKRRAIEWENESDASETRIRRLLIEKGLKRIKTAEVNKEEKAKSVQEEKRKNLMLIEERIRTRWRILFHDTDPRPPPGYLMFRPVDGRWMRSQCDLLNLNYTLDKSFPPPILQKLRAQSNLCEVRQAPGETIRIGDDGNCLFRALAWWVTGSEEQHRAMRTKIVHFMMRFPKSFGGKLSGPEGQLYTRERNRHMFSDGEWGTQCEIYGAATLLGVDIYTYHVNRWKRYHPLFEWRFADGYKVTRRIAPHERTRYGIYLANDSNLHYDVVKYMEPTAPKTDTCYRLLGTILHHGRTIESGHYTANIFDQESQKWLYCNDDHVVTRSTIKVLEEAMAHGYVLVYGKVKSMVEQESDC